MSIRARTAVLGQHRSDCRSWINAGAGLQPKRVHSRKGSSLKLWLATTKPHRLTSAIALHTVLGMCADRHCCGGDDNQAAAALQLTRRPGWRTGVPAAAAGASRLQTRPRPATAAGPSPAAAPGAPPASAPAAWRCSALATAQVCAAVAVQCAPGINLMLLDAPPGHRQHTEGKATCILAMNRSQVPCSVAQCSSHPTCKMRGA